MRRRSKLEKKYVLAKEASQIDNLKIKLINIEKQLQISYRKSASTEEKRAVDAIKVNPKNFYSFAKSKSKTKTKVGLLKAKVKLKQKLVFC